MLPLTIWMNIPSFYQGDLFRALVSTGEVDLEVIFAHELPADRQQLGWHNDLSGYKYHFLSGLNPIYQAARLAWKNRDRFHIVNGIWAEPTFAAALAVLAFTSGRYAIYSEAVNPNRRRSRIKKAVQSGFGRFIVQRAAGLLPVARLGEEFYRSLGAKNEQIYSFGYFRSKPAINQIRQVAEKEKVELIFVGQLVQRKGVDLVLEAIVPLVSTYKHLIFTIVGDGEWRSYLQKQTHQMGLDKHVHFTGVLPATQIPTRIRQADALILPSRWDGWGLVVNEALSVGIPVIVSNNCGASDLVQDDVNGYIFQNENVEDLKSKLDKFLTQKEDWLGFREKAIDIGQKISTEHIVHYLIDCINYMQKGLHSPPKPPWKLNQLMDVNIERK